MKVDCIRRENMNQNMEEKIKAIYMNAFFGQDKNQMNMFLMVSKSLKNNQKTRTVEMDIQRFKCELDYFGFYKEKEEYIPHLNMFIPLILSVKNVERRTFEMERLVEFYYRYNEKEMDFEFLLSGHAYSLIVDILMEDANSPIEVIIGRIKTFLIEYRPNFELSKLQKIRFEMSRINMIKCMDPVDPRQYNEKTAARMLLQFLAGYELHDYSDTQDQIARTLSFIFGREESDRDAFARNMAEYIFKLREFKIAKGGFSGMANPTAIRSLEKDAVHNDMLFNKIIVLDKTADASGTKVKIRSKSGEYVFKFE